MNNYFKINKKAFLLGTLRQSAILITIAIIYTILNFNGFNFATFGIWITALVLPIFLNSYVLFKNYRANKKTDKLIANSKLSDLKNFNFERHWYSESKFDLKDLTLKNPDNLIIKPKSISEIEIINAKNIHDFEIKLKKYDIHYSLNTFDNILIVKDIDAFTRIFK